MIAIDDLRVSRAPIRARANNAARLLRRRAAERADARDYLVHGDEAGHRNVCIHALAGDAPCARDYDPLPAPLYSEARPTPSHWYDGTGVGALYGLPNTERHLWQLAGWNVAWAGRDEKP